MDTNKMIDRDNIGSVCCNCLKESVIYSIEIPSLGYGSNFDNLSTRVDLCSECFLETDEKWWKFEVIVDDSYYGFCRYKYEDELLDYISHMPLAGQELVNAYYAEGACADYMQGQDWIDYHLGILPHEKCKEYGCYSHEEISAYKDRFPICDKVYKKTYEDGSSHTLCSFGASGNSDGSCGGNIYGSCYMCKQYNMRADDFEMVHTDEFADFKKREIERLNDMIEYATIKLKELQ